LISTVGQELPIGPAAEANVLQVTVPDVDGQVGSSDPTYLGLTYLTGDGAPISGALAASASLSISGTSVYDGSNLSNTGADVTFYLDPTATLVNIDGQSVGRTTVETVNNPKRTS
jgi:hypothetical protein